jgi:hypothetical protein
VHLRTHGTEVSSSGRRLYILPGFVVITPKVAARIGTKLVQARPAAKIIIFPLMCIGMDRYIRVYIHAAYRVLDLAGMQA